VKTILVLDDEPSNLSAIRAVLQVYGYNVLEAAAGAEAIQICNDHDGPIDLLIADVSLPDSSGTQIALEILKHCPNMPVLFISGTPIEGWWERDLKNFQVLPLELVDVLPKPFQASVLAARVEMLLKAASGFSASNVPNTSSR
jgi:two-component system cell cycle sensor histidine kinase/response regulator CckA